MIICASTCLCLGCCVWIAVFRSLCSGPCVQVAVVRSLCSGHCVQVAVVRSLCSGPCVQVAVVRSLCSGCCVYIAVFGHFSNHQLWRIWYGKEHFRAGAKNAKLRVGKWSWGQGMAGRCSVPLMPPGSACSPHPPGQACLSAPREYSTPRWDSLIC